MSIHDRDWYRDEMKNRAKGSTLRRARPPEPHEWPKWVIAFIWLVVALFAVFAFDRFVVKPRGLVHVQKQTIQLPDCAHVSEGPCIKHPS